MRVALVARIVLVCVVWVGFVRLGCFAGSAWRLDSVYFARRLDSAVLAQIVDFVNFAGLMDSVCDDLAFLA